MNLTGSVRLDDKFWVWFGRANQDSLNVVQELFRDEGEQRSLDLLKWQYLDRLGGAFVAIAHTVDGVHEGAAALYSALPSLVHSGVKTLSAVQSFDSITSKQFRGRGLFSRLGKFAYDKFRESGVELVYGIPNENINNVRIAQLGWNSLDPLPFLVKPFGLRYLRVRAHARKPAIGAGGKLTQVGQVRRVEECPIDVTDLFLRSELSERVGVVRDYEYLSWRLKRPGSSYVHFECRRASGELLGYAVYELVLKHGCATGYFMELMSDVRHPEAASDLARAVLADMRERGADVALAWWMKSSVAAKTLQHHGFFPLPERLRPIRLHLGYRFLSGGPTITRDQFSFSYLDSDTV
jgi:hypothetical protein